MGEEIPIYSVPVEPESWALPEHQSPCVPLRPGEMVIIQNSQRKSLRLRGIEGWAHVLSQGSSLCLCDHRV